MKYTIVWNKNKTEGIILSGKDRLKDAEHAADISNTENGFWLSPVAFRFRSHYGLAEKCTIQDGLVPMQPTEEMIKAGMDDYFDCKRNGDTVEDMIVFIWQAMVQEMNK